MQIWVPNAIASHRVPLLFGSPLFHYSGVMLTSPKQRSAKQVDSLYCRAKNQDCHQAMSQNRFMAIVAVTFSLHIFQSEKIKFSNFLEFVIKRLIEFTQIFCNCFVTNQSFQIRLHRCHVDHCCTILFLQ